MATGAPAAYQDLLGTANGDSDSAAFREYPSRWAALAIFGLGSMGNAMVWIAFAPIASITADYYGVSTTAVNMLSVVYLILFVPGTYLGSLLYARIGLRQTLLWANALCLVGTALRYGSAHDDGSPSRAGYPLLLVGQALAGLVQPVYVNAASKIASVWFRVESRDVATTIAALFNPVGTGIGSLIPSLLVSSDRGMPALLLVQFAYTAVVVIITAVWFREGPPTPPSRTQARRDAAAEDTAGVSPDPFALTTLRRLFADPAFRWLCLGFAVGLAYFNTLVTVLGQQVGALGYSSDAAGVYGLLLLVFGIAGCAVFGPIMDATHAYRTLIRGLSAAVLGCVFLLCFALRPGHGVLLGVAFAALGFFTLPLVPISFETMVEVTYPLAEDVTNGIMLAVGNVLSIGTVFIWQALIHQNGDDYHGTFVGYNYFQFGLMLCAVVLLWLFDGEYRRLAAEEPPELDDGKIIDSGRHHRHERSETEFTEETI